MLNHNFKNQLSYRNKPQRQSQGLEQEPQSNTRTRTPSDNQSSFGNKKYKD